MTVRWSVPGSATPIGPTYWVLVPAVVGAVTGLCVGVVVTLIETWLLEDVVLGLPGLWFAVPAVAVFVLTRLALLRVAGTTSPGTAELYPIYYHDSRARYPLRQVPGRLLSGAATVGIGGSQGLESQSVMIGDTWGVILRRLSRRRLAYLGTPDGRRYLFTCGAAAGIATVFSSPILGALYGVEMPFRNRLDWRRLVPAAVAATASFLTAALTRTARDFVHYVDHDVQIREIVGVLIVAVACGFGARLFARASHAVRPWQSGRWPWVRAVVAGVALSLLAMLAWSVTGAAITAGPGYVAADWAVSPTGDTSAGVWILCAALLLRVASVLLCVAAGGGGGVFTSMATNGLLIGVTVAVVLDIDNVTLLAVAGACAFLGAGYRIPLATAGLAIGIIGFVPPAALAVAAVILAIVCMGPRASASAGQRTGFEAD